MRCPGKLRDCLKHLTGREHEKQHDAAEDVAACAAVYKELLRRQRIVAAGVAAPQQRAVGPPAMQQHVRSARASTDGAQPGEGTAAGIDAAATAAAATAGTTAGRATATRIGAGSAGAAGVSTSTAAVAVAASTAAAAAVTPWQRQQQQQQQLRQAQQQAQQQGRNSQLEALLALWARPRGNSVVVHVETEGGSSGCADDGSASGASGAAAGSAGGGSERRIVRMAWQVLGPAPALKRKRLMRPGSFRVLPADGQARNMVHEQQLQRRQVVQQPVADAGPMEVEAEEEQEGEAALPIAELMEAFANDLEECEVLVAHDAETQVGAIAAELRRPGLQDALAALQGRRVLCTMRAGQVALGLPARHSLTQLFALLPCGWGQRKEQEESAASGAVAAMRADVESVAGCYAALLENVAPGDSGSGDESEEMEYENEDTGDECSSDMEDADE